ncbi:uncharacterized protein LOC128394393 [Panonychus citri]|uniref:uncharacterized protein LOC128389224 n=1 Tax=Panonychus citri TaxID=50023 RepID=UPI00230742B9|nr:uncharacterized protein LOC128389224 [Panonychus citri]XP_053210688.1 uncharacterized protein LOC128394393 [Panonychus citri]
MELGTIKNSSAHNHGQQLDKIIQIEQRNKGKDYVKLENFPNLKSCYQKSSNDIMQTHQGDIVGASLKTFRSLKKTLSRARSSRYPPLPANRAEITIPDKLRNNFDNETFFRISDGDSEKILIFATDKFLNYLSSSDHVYADGTFKSVPKLFHSLYTFHVMVNGVMIPTVYALIPSANYNTYLRLIRLVQDLCAAINLTWNPDFFTTDFEMASMKAIKTCFPACTLKSCLFHFGQNIWRNVVKHQLRDLYNEQNSEVYKTIRRISALPFLNIVDIHDTFDWIVSESPQLDNLDDFIHYFKSTYLLDDSRFPVSTWNHYNDRDPRTNNHVEGWHFALNKSMGRNHANLWIFIEKIIQHQNSFETNLLMASFGATINVTERKTLDINRRIQNLTAEYSLGHLTPFEFIDKIKYYTKLSDSNRISIVD